MYLGRWFFHNIFDYSSNGAQPQRWNTRPR
jgi:hypothetical protein